MGHRGCLNRIEGLRMQAFNAVDVCVAFRGRVTELQREGGQVDIELWSEAGGKRTVTATASVTLR